MNSLFTSLMSVQLALRIASHIFYQCTLNFRKTFDETYIESTYRSVS